MEERRRAVGEREREEGRKSERGRRRRRERRQGGEGARTQAPLSPLGRPGAGVAELGSSGEIKPTLRLPQMPTLPLAKQLI